MLGNFAETAAAAAAAAAKQAEVYQEQRRSTKEHAVEVLSQMLAPVTALVPTLMLLAPNGKQRACRGTLGSSCLPRIVQAKSWQLDFPHLSLPNDDFPSFHNHALEILPELISCNDPVRIPPLSIVVVVVVVAAAAAAAASLSLLLRCRHHLIDDDLISRDPTNISICDPFSQ